MCAVEIRHVSDDESARSESACAVSRVASRVRPRPVVSIAGWPIYTFYRINVRSRPVLPRLLYILNCLCGPVCVGLRDGGWSELCRLRWSVGFRNRVLSRNLHMCLSATLEKICCFFSRAPLPLLGAASGVPGRGSGRAPWLPVCSSPVSLLLAS